MHEAAKVYLMWLFKDTNLCTIHAKHVTITLKIYGWQEESGGSQIYIFPCISVSLQERGALYLTNYACVKWAHYWLLIAFS